MGVIHEIEHKRTLCRDLSDVLCGRCRGTERRQLSDAPLTAPSGSRGGPEFEGLARACLDGLLPRHGIRQALSDGSSKREPTLEREFVSRHAMKGDAV